MPIEIRVPTLGESIVEATVGAWRKQVGDTVAPGDILVELETDKINVEVAADQAGVLERIDRPAGSNVAVGDVLGAVGAAAAQPAASSAAPAAPPTGRAPAPDGRQPATPVARNIASANKVDLGVLQGSGPGGRVTKTDVAAQLRAEAPGGSEVEVQESHRTAELQNRGTVEPLERREIGRDALVSPPASQPPTPTTYHPSSGGPEERIRMSRRRQTIARRLVEAQRTAAMLTTFNEIDLSAVTDLRKRRGQAFQDRHGIRLGLMSFFVKAVIGALKFQPRLNAEIQGDELVLKHYYDIGIAVAAEEGLVVPVLRGADRMSFAAIEQGIADLGKRARENTLGLADLQGGSFTITNGGIFGSLMSTPILNHPQVGILGMHAIKERPVAVNGQVVIRPMMYVALSYDHRIVDGSEAVRFLVRMKELVEDPEALLLDG